MLARFTTAIVLVGLSSLASADPRVVIQSHYAHPGAPSYHVSGQDYHYRQSSRAYRQGYRDGLRDQRYGNNYHRQYRHRLQVGTRYHQHGPHCGHALGPATRVQVYWRR